MREAMLDDQLMLHAHGWIGAVSSNFAHQLHDAIFNKAHDFSVQARPKACLFSHKAAGAAVNRRIHAQEDARKVEHLSAIEYGTNL